VIVMAPPRRSRAARDPALRGRSGVSARGQARLRDVDEEDPLPPCVLREDAAEEHGRPCAAAANRTQMPSALLRSEPSSNVVVMIDSNRGRDDRCSNTLQRARCDQHADVLASRKQETPREDCDPIMNSRLDEQVGCAPPEQKQASERDRCTRSAPIAACCRPRAARS